LILRAPDPLQERNSWMIFIRVIRSKDSKSELTGKSVAGGPSTIGLGIGVLASVVYAIKLMSKK